jgi:cyclopropane fatty-acyl-phospholipid synthase-like methyltransferase
MSDYRQRIYQGYLEAGAAAAVSDKLAEFERREPYLKKLIREHFPADRGTAILDLGCGAGALEYVAGRLGYARIVGVDRSPPQVAAAHRLGLVSVQEGDLLAALESQADASQGLVIAFDVLEHFRKDEVMGFLDQVYRVLAPGGKLLIHTPNGASPLGGRVACGDFTHETIFTRESLAQLLTACGFSQVDCFEDQPVAHGLVSGLRWLLWQMLRGWWRFYLAVETGSLDRREIFSQNMLGVAVK